MVLAIGFSHNVVLTAAAMATAGMVNMLAIALLNAGVQFSVPRWVAGRALAGFQASLTGGVAVGAWLWGHLAAPRSVEFAFLSRSIPTRRDSKRARVAARPHSFIFRRSSDVRFHL